MSLAEEIAELEVVLNVGAKSVAVDGIKTDYDLDQVRRRIRELKAEQDPAARPRVAQVDMRGF